MLSRNKYLLLAVLLTFALSLYSCDAPPSDDENDTQEEMDFSDEAVDTEDEDGFDFPADEDEDASGEYPPEEVEDFDEASCANYPVYVPCGTFMADPGSGTMTCPNQTMALNDSPREFITLIPQNGGNELFARAAGSATGTLSLIGTTDNDRNASYAGPLINAEGVTIFYTLEHISDPGGLGYIFGTFKLVVNNPGVGNCTVERAYDGFQQ